MPGNDAFERACRDAARSLRRVPKELRQTIAADSRDEVAAPLVQALQHAAVGPWARQLAAGTKARKAADPTVVIGGARPVVSGGAGVRQLVYGNQWGGGKRVTTVTRGRSRYRLRSTRQFRTPHPYIIRTLSQQGGAVLDAWARLVMRAIERSGVTDG